MILSIDTFFGTASPTTLASLIADVEGLSKGAELDQLRLEALARKALVAYVGKAEADALIDAAFRPNQPSVAAVT